MKTTLGEKFAILGAIKRQVAEVEASRDLDTFLDANADPVALAEREVLDIALEWATATGPEASIRLQEAVMRLHAARGNQ